MATDFITDTATMTTEPVVCMTSAASAGKKNIVKTAED